MDYIYAKLNYEVLPGSDYNVAEEATPASENLHEYRLLKDGVAVGDTIVVPKADVSTLSYKGIVSSWRLWELEDGIYVFDENGLTESEYGPQGNEDKEWSSLIKYKALYGYQYIAFSNYGGEMWIGNNQEGDTTWYRVIYSNQESWITPTLTNSWIAEDSPTTEVRYMKDQLGFVHFKGIIQSGTVGQNAFVLPAGYRPKNTLMFACIDGLNSIARVDVNSSGGVNIATGNNARISLDGITFKAEL